MKASPPTSRMAAIRSKRMGTGLMRWLRLGWGSVLRWEGSNGRRRGDGFRASSRRG